MVVLVVGITGVGKSTFISKLIGEDVGIGRDLTSC
jgi:GTPase Era involved in 16S rRNA processing